MFCEFYLTNKLAVECEKRFIGLFVTTAFDKYFKTIFQIHHHNHLEKSNFQIQFKIDQRDGYDDTSQQLMVHVVLLP